MEKCPFYKNGHAEKRKHYGNKLLFCKIEECPYGNAGKLTFQGEEIGTICKSNGLVEKVAFISPRFGMSVIPEFKIRKEFKLPLKFI